MTRSAMPHSNSAHEGLQARSTFVLLMLLAAIALGAGLGLRDPSPPDEPRFVLAAQHMVESGDWLVPHRGRELYAEKPPVFMWLQAAAYQLVGDWRWAFLLPSWLAALGTLWLTHDLARRLWGPRFALYAPAALLVCVQFGLQAKRGQIDMVLVFLTTLSLWGLLRHLLRGPDRLGLYLGMFAAGVGTVTKGVGFLPLLAVLPWALVRSWDSRAKPGASDAPGNKTKLIGGQVALALASFIAGTAVWLGPLSLALIASNDPALHAYAGELLFKQTGERYVNAWHHVQPAWYYLQVVATLWLPGALLLPWLLPQFWRRLRAGDTDQWVLLGWCVVTLLFFSASPGKREVYIFPVLPALCVAAAPMLPALLERRGVQRTLLGYAAVFATVLLALGVSGLSGHGAWAHKLAAQRDLGAVSLKYLLLWLAGGGAIGLLLAGWGRLRRSATVVVLFTSVLWIVYGLGIAPALDASSSSRKLMERVAKHIGPGAQLGLIAWREQNLLQATGPVVEFGFKQPWRQQWAAAALWASQDARHRWIFVLAEAVSPCVDRAYVVPIGTANRRQWVLVPAAALDERCTTPPLADESIRQSA